MNHDVEAIRALSELAEYWGTLVRAVPDQVFRNPEVSAPFVEQRLTLLRSVLSPKEYSEIRATIHATVVGETRASPLGAARDAAAREALARKIATREAMSRGEAIGRA